LLFIPGVFQFWFSSGHLLVGWQLPLPFLFFCFAVSVRLLGNILRASSPCAFFSALANTWMDRPGCHSCVFRNATSVCRFRYCPVRRLPVQLLRPPLPLREFSDCVRRRSNNVRYGSR